MAISLVNNLSMNRSDTAVADDVWTATSATLSDFQAPGADLVKLATATPTSGTTVDMTSVFSSTYRFYKLFMWDVEWSNENRPELSYLVGGTEDTGNYYVKYTGASGGTGTYSGNNGAETNADGFRLSDGYGQLNGQNPNFMAEVTFFNPNSNVTYSSINFTSQTNDGTNWIIDNGIGYYATAIAATGLRFKGSAGGTFTSGALELYGFKAG